LFGVADRAPDGALDRGVHVAQALDWSAAHGGALPARYGILAHDLGVAPVRAGEPAKGVPVLQSVRLAEAMSARLKVPLDCRDAARLAARWGTAVHRAPELPPAQLLDLLNATDAMRRPDRLETLLDICMADACSRPGVSQDYSEARVLREARAVVKDVNAGAVAQSVGKGKSATGGDDAIARAVRAARLKALRTWRRQGR
jgi:tRNA nucleotidyltransferase (CCA-adding enzyme)